MPVWTAPLKRRLALWNRRRLRRRHLARQLPYAQWCARHDGPTPTRRQAWEQAVAQRELELDTALLLVASTPPDAAQLASLRAQTLRHWRLLVALTGANSRAAAEPWQAEARADARVHLHPDPQPDAATALRTLLAATAQPWCAVLDAHERWAPHALLALQAAVRKDTVLVYGDEDSLDARGERIDPWFKPDFDADSLWAMDSLGAPALWRTSALRERLGTEPLEPGAERHDLLLRGTQGLTADLVHHVPGVLAHRRALQCDALAASRAVQRALLRAGVAGCAEPDADPPAARAGLVRVRFAVPAPAPLVSIVIPTRNGLELLQRAVESIRKLTTWPRYDITVVDNGSDDTACLRWMAAAERAGHLRVLRDDRPFNFAALNNAAVARMTGDLIALVNNDVELLTPGWLEEMVSLALQPGVGAVGARLWYEDGTLQHGGVLLGIGEVAAHALRGLPRGNGGPGARTLRLQGYRAVTAACLVVQRAHWQRVGGMDEGLAVAFNDIDFCLKLAAAGLRNLWTPHAEMLHFESVSRGRDHDPAKKARYRAEAAVMRQRWGPWIATDPFYNPQLSSVHDDFSLADPPR